MLSFFHRKRAQREASKDQIILEHYAKLKEERETIIGQVEQIITNNPGFYGQNALDRAKNYLEQLAAILKEKPNFNIPQPVNFSMIDKIHGIQGNFPYMEGYLDYFKTLGTRYVEIQKEIDRIDQLMLKHPFKNRKVNPA